MTPIASAFARALAMDGLTASEIAAQVIRAGYRITEDEAKDVWLQCDEHRRLWPEVIQK